MKISVSVLDCISRSDGVKVLNDANIDYIHVDVMDGKFVPKISFGEMNEIIDIGKVSKYPMDIHLMVDNPILYINGLKNLNARYITFHLEIDKDINSVISAIKGCGYKVGISIKPNTDVRDIVPYLNDIDLILVMSVEPGMGGQKFIDSTIDRIGELKQLISKIDRDIVIEVDGGVNDETINKLNGVDIAVVGSYITKSDNYVERVNKLRSVIDRKVV